MLITLFDPWFHTPPLKPEHHGYAAHYSPGLMSRVAKRRGIVATECMLATDLYPLKTMVRIQSKLNGTVLYCKVVDVSMPKDRQRHLRSHLYAELDFQSATVICEIKRVGERPWRQCPIILSELNT